MFNKLKFNKQKDPSHCVIFMYFKQIKSILLHIEGGCWHFFIIYFIKTRLATKKKVFLRLV